MLTAADTAYAIATIRAMEADRPATERLFDDPFARIFRDAGAHAAEGTRRFLELPMFVDAIRLRTRFIDDFVREGLGEGLRQIVLMGAGFDARALRMRELANGSASVWEIDLEPQLARKRTLLAAAAVTLPAHVRYVACDFAVADFASGLLARLAEQGFCAGARALFVWEGVIAYIDAQAIERSLRFMVDAGGRGSRLVFDFSPATMEHDPAPARTRRAGFTHFEEHGYDAIWRRYLPGEPHPNAGFVSMGAAFV